MPLHPTSGHSLVTGSTRQWFFDQLVDTCRLRRDFSSHRHHPNHHRAVRSRNFGASLPGLSGHPLGRQSRIDRHIISRSNLGQYPSSSICHHLSSSSCYVDDPLTTIAGCAAVAFVVFSNSRRQHRRNQQRQSSAPNKIIANFYRTGGHELQQIDNGSRSCLKMIRNNNNNNHGKNNRRNANISDDDDLYGGELFWLIVSLGTAAATVTFGNNTTACLLFSILYGSFAYGLGKPYILQDYLENDREEDDDESPPPVFLVSYFAALLSASILTPLSMTSSASSSSQSLSLSSISSPIITASGGDGEGLGWSLTLLGIGVLVGSIVVSPRLVRDGTNKEITGKPKSEAPPTINRIKKEDSDGDDDDDDDDDENIFLDASKRNEQQRLLDLWDQKLQQNSDDIDRC